MGYELRGVVGRNEPTTALAGELALPVIGLAQGFALVPWTPDDFDRLGPSDRETEPAGFLYTHSILMEAIARRSGATGLAYVAAELFGGVGDQGAVLYRSGSLEWISEFGPIRKSMRLTPISQALQILGVDRTGHVDEFAAVGLGRHRRTEDWRAGH